MARQSQAPTATILLTRPEPGASATAAALRRELGEVPILLSPLMAVQELTPKLPGAAFSAAVFTSRAGVAAAIRLREAGYSLPQIAYAVGDATAAAAREAGFQAQSAGGDAAALLALLWRENPAGPLLHLRGREAGDTLAKGLNSAGIETFEALVYAQIPVPLTAAARQLLIGTGRVILPLFSPRTATLFHAATRHLTPRAPLDIVAMSPAVAEAAAPIPAVQRSIAAEPTEAAMVWSVATRLRQNPDLNGTGSDP
jgi:uroporphyrinogen-III synthase